MLLLKRQATNKIVTSLSQVVTGLADYYLFSFFHQQKREYFNFFMPISESNIRYEIFLLSLPETVDLPKGNYTYSIYESVDEEPTTEGKFLLYSGKAEVLTDFQEGEFYVVNSTNQILYA